MSDDAPTPPDDLPGLLGSPVRLSADDRAVVESAMQAGEEQFRTFVENVPGAVYRCAPDDGRRMEYVSEAIEELTGYPSIAYLVGLRSYSTLIHEDDREAVDAAIEAALAARRPFDVEYRILTAERELRWIHERGRGVVAADGSVEWIDGALFDVTARREAEACAEATTALLLTLIESLRSGVLVEDADRRIAFVNQVLCDDFGLGTEREALLGADVQDAQQLMLPLFSEPEAVAGRIAEIAEAWQPVRGEELQLADDRVLELEHVPVELTSGHGGRLWHFRDVTQHKRIERELARQNHELRRLDRMKDDFVALVTHELRTPVTSIMGYVELLLEDADELADGHVHGLEVIRRNARRLLRLVGDLLFVAQLEAGQPLALEEAALALEEVVRESLEAQRVRAERNGVTLHLDPGPAGVMLGDVGRLGQLVDNLVSNAIKYSPDGGDVRIAIRQTGATVVLEVCDSGIGIPAHEQPHLFERFFRATTATGRAIPGTGLGLSITRRIVEAHGGSISFESEESRGTTFRVQLPAATTRAAA